MPIDIPIPEQLTQDARTATEQYAARLDRALADDDVERTIGASKDLFECVAKVVLDSLGLTYAANEDLPKLATNSLKALEAHPSAYQDRSPIQQLTQALVRVPGAVAELRNRDGTGHGRAQPTDLFLESADFVAEITIAWCRWVLTALSRVLEGIEDINAAVEMIQGNTIFRVGDLRQLLDSLDLDILASDQQRVLGISVGRRAARGTFNVDTDVLEPLSERQADFPLHFLEGIIEGALVDAGGYVRTRAQTVRRVLAIIPLLGDGAPALLAKIADQVETTELAYAFRPEHRREVMAALDAGLGALDEDLSGPLFRITQRIREFEEEEDA